MGLTSGPVTHRAGAQKLLGVLITIGEAVAYVVSGMYGDVRELGTGNAILIIVQVRIYCRFLPNSQLHRWAAAYINQANLHTRVNISCR